MRLTQTLVAILGIAVLPGMVSAQFYQQDFSANFPPPIANPGMVTVIMTNESGDTIIPYENYPIPGLTDYVGRPQVAARTGGANANQEVSAITSVYTANGADTTAQYPIDPLPETGGNGAYPPDRILDDAFITMSEDGINDIQSAVAWDQQYGGGYDTATHTFLFRISGVGNPANDQADGMGWTYLNSDIHGESGVIGPGTSEEPNFEGSLGVGFDIWDNGGEGGNSVSLHYDGTTLKNVIIDDGTTDPNTGQDWAFNSFETDEIITTQIIVTAGDPLDFTQPVLKGGSPYAVSNRSGAPSILVQDGGDGSMDGHLRVAEEADSVFNVMAFDYDGSGASSEYHATFNFRGLTTPGSNRADGMSFLLVPVDQYGETGADDLNFSIAAEEPDLAGAFGVGFDTYNNDAAAQDDPEGMPDVGNHVSIYFDGAKEWQENLDITEMDLVTADPEVWHTARIDIVGDDVAVVLTDGSDGSEHVVFADTIPGLSQMGPIRPAFAARTGGAFDNYEIDNFLLTTTDMIRGDFNNDGVLDAADVNALTAESASGANNIAYDLTGDSVVDAADVAEWIGADNIYKSWLGDANLDGEFNSGDLVTVLGAGKYESGDAAVWTEGDFNGDGLANTGDLVTALGGGGYELGPKAAVSAVPEPASATLLLLGSLMFIRRRRK